MTTTLKAPASWMDGTPISVWVVGAGGNGGEVADALAQFHTALIALGSPGLRVAIFDDAVVREVNLVRQRFWKPDIGQNKAITLAHRYNTLLGMEWQGIPMRLEEAIARYKPSAGPDIIISAVDTASCRRYIGKLYQSAAKKYDEEGLRRSSLEDTVWLDLGNHARNGQAVLGKLNDAHYPNVIAHYPEIALLEDDNTKSCSTAEAIASQDCLINRSVATAGMSILWDLLRHGETSKNGVVIDLASGIHLPIEFP